MALAATAANNGLSFSGFTFTAGERLARVLIVAGNADLATGVGDSVATDVIAMDDFIFGEPRAMEDHPADFDGDGGTDLSVFRPSEGRWYHQGQRHRHRAGHVVRPHRRHPGGRRLRRRRAHRPGRLPPVQRRVVHPAVDGGPPPPCSSG